MKKILTILLIGVLIISGISGSALSTIALYFHQSSNFEEYDMVIITPQIFTNTLQPLIDHKINVGIQAILKTLESIYDEYQGRFTKEQALSINFSEKGIDIGESYFINKITGYSTMDNEKRNSFFTYKN